MNFFEALRGKFTASNRSAREVSQDLGVSRRSFQKWVSGESDPKPENKAVLYKYFRMHEYGVEDEWTSRKL